MRLHFRIAKAVALHVSDGFGNKAKCLVKYVIYKVYNTLVASEVS